MFKRKQMRTWMTVLVLSSFCLGSMSVHAATSRTTARGLEIYDGPNKSLGHIVYGLKGFTATGETVAGEASPKTMVVQLDKVDMAGNRIENVAAGVNDTDAVNFAQLKAYAGGSTQTAKWQTGVSGATDAPVDIGGDKGLFFEAGKNLSLSLTTEEKAPAVLHVKMADDLKVSSVTAKALAIADGPAMDQSGINMAAKKITHLAAGEADTDAVNMSQLKAVGETLNSGLTAVHSRIGNLQTESREGDAMNAALAALKPIDFNPAEPNQIMA